jgi:hypothetical protein
MKRERQPQSNPFLWYIDNLQEKFSKITFLDPKLLLTENRHDILLRVDFLTEVIINKQDSSKTKYFKFIIDKDKGISRDPTNVTSDFLNLYYDIKQNNIVSPILVGKYDSSKIPTRYIFENQKFWFDIENKSGYQLMDGAHRLSVALFLEISSIPVKIINSLAFEIPNYTQYIKKKEK